MPKSKARSAVWRHNSFLGHACMMETNLHTIMAAPTTTTATKRICNDLLTQIPDLKLALKERVDDNNSKN